MKNPSALSIRQVSILEFIIDEVEQRGYPPSVREIGLAVGLQSSSTVHNHLNQIERKGYIQRDATKPRAIAILKRADESAYVPFSSESESNSSDVEEMVNLPVFGAVAAGVPIFADDSIEDQISLPMRFVRDEGAFMLRVKGESMIGVGIMDGDYVIVAPRQSAKNGDVVVALIGDEATCKTYYREKHQIRLQPENPTMEPIFVQNPMIIGQVIGVFRDMH